jgi:hypothetical protein
MSTMAEGFGPAAATNVMQSTELVRRREEQLPAMLVIEAQRGLSDTFASEAFVCGGMNATGRRPP